MSDDHESDKRDQDSERQPDASGAGHPAEISRRLKGLAVAVSVLVAAVAAIITNIDLIISKINSACVAMTYCPPGNHYVNSLISTIPPWSGAVPDLLELPETWSPGAFLVPYSSILRNDADFNGIELEIFDGSIHFREEGRLPLQTTFGEIMYWSPEEGEIGWKIGAPILDVLLSRRDKSLDITEIDVLVLNSRLDETPYAQVVTSATGFSELMIINESIHDAIDVSINFRIGEDWPLCSAADSFDYQQELPHSRHLSGLGGIENLNISEELEGHYAGFSDVQHYFSRLEEDVEATKDNYDLLVQQGLGARFAVVYGIISATAVGGEEYRSRFCAQVQVGVPPDVGGGFIELSEGRVVPLDVRSYPYVVNQKIMYTINEKTPAYRAAMMLVSDKSSWYEIQLLARSYERLIYRSPPIKLHVFIPKTTYKEMGINLSRLRARNTETDLSR